MLIDTDILIFYSRGSIKAQQTLQQIDTIKLSIVSYMEYIQGVKNKRELQEFEKWLKQKDIMILPINEKISVQASQMVRQYALSHSLYMGDALIAATALHYKDSLLTANIKHYKMIESLELLIFKP
jgi:hypothetical protein